MGPPLEVTFKEEISEEGADQAVKIYREYYETKGQMEAHLYDGIKRFSSTLVKILTRKSLSQLQKMNHCSKMCQHLGITEYFDGIYGSTCCFS